MLALLERFSVLVDFILLSEVNLVNWLLNLALKGSFEIRDLVMLIHGVAWNVVRMEACAQLVVGVHVDFLLQLSADIFVLLGWAKMLVEFIVGARWLFLGFLTSLRLFSNFLRQVLIVYFVSIFIEFDNQIMFLSNS